MKNFFQFLAVLPALVIFVGYAPISAEERKMPPVEASKPTLSGHDAATGTMVVARVNGIEITMPELVAKVRTLTRNKTGKENLTPVLAEQTRQKALDMLITEELAYQHARTLTIKITPEEVSQSIKELKENFGDEKNFQNYLVLNNLTSEESLRAQMEKFLLVQKAILQEALQDMKIDEKTVEKAYQANIKQFTKKERVDIVDVVFFLDHADGNSLQTARQIRADLVNKFASDPAALPEDGTFAIRKDVTLNKDTDKELYDAAKALKENEVSDVLIIKETLHLIKLTGYNPEKITPFEEAKPLLMKELTAKLRQNKLGKWKADLRKDAKIEVLNFTIAK